MAQVGKELPDVTLWEKNPHDAIKLREVCNEKKCVIIGVPGAFTPTCSETHLPGFIQHYDEIIAQNVDLIACVAVCDAFVMNAWGKDQNVGDKIRMWADTQMELSKALDVVLKIADVLGNDRCQRFAMIVENNVIKSFFVEEEPPKATVTSAESILAALKA